MFQSISVNLISQIFKFLTYINYNKIPASSIYSWMHKTSGGWVSSPTLLSIFYVIKVYIKKHSFKKVVTSSVSFTFLLMSTFLLVKLQIFEGKWFQKNSFLYDFAFCFLVNCATGIRPVAGSKLRSSYRTCM